MQEQHVASEAAVSELMQRVQHSQPLQVRWPAHQSYADAAALSLQLSRQSDSPATHWAGARCLSASKQPPANYLVLMPDVPRHFWIHTLFTQTHTHDITCYAARFEAPGNWERLNSKYVKYCFQKKPRLRSSCKKYCKKVNVAHIRLPSVGFRSWSRFLAVSLLTRES